MVFDSELILDFVRSNTSINLQVLLYLQTMKLTKSLYFLSTFPSSVRKYITLFICGIIIEYVHRKNSDQIFLLVSQQYCTLPHLMEQPITHQFQTLIPSVFFKKK